MGNNVVHVHGLKIVELICIMSRLFVIVHFTELKRSHCFLISLFYIRRVRTGNLFEQCFEAESSSQRQIILMIIYYTTVHIIKGHVSDSLREWRKIIPNYYWWVNQDNYVNFLCPLVWMVFHNHHNKSQMLMVEVIRL